jgi:thymidylate synthase (FAD)
MIKARLITEPCSDLKVVNSARVSMKVSHDTFDDIKDVKLVNYLAKHGHWSPFSHNRDIMFFRVESRAIYNTFIQMITVSLSAEEKTGMVIQEFPKIDGYNYIAIKTSYFGWVNIVKSLVGTYFDNDGSTLETIISTLHNKYPVSTAAYLDKELINTYSSLEYYNINTNILASTLPFLEQKMFDITFYETVPIFVARQRFKHMVLNTYNEISKRYVDDIPEAYHPDIWRLRPDKSIKQGSGGDHPETAELSVEYEAFMKMCLSYYDKLVNVDKVAPEQARMVIPQSMMTEYYVTANMDAWDRFIVQRQYAGAQKEIRDLADIVDSEITNIKKQVSIIQQSNGNMLQQLTDIGVF